MDSQGLDSAIGLFVKVTGVNYFSEPTQSFIQCKAAGEPDPLQGAAGICSHLLPPSCILKVSAPAPARHNEKTGCQSSIPLSF